MRFFANILIIVELLIFPAVSHSFVGEPSLGTNIAVPKAYTGDLMFVDRMKQSTSWTTPIGVVEFDAHGYPLEVATENQQMSKYLFQSMDGIYPAGDYTVKFKGTGTVWVRSPAVCADLGGQCVITGTDVTRTVKIPASAGTIQLKLIASDVKDPITDINFIMPGFESSYLTNPVHPDYLSGLAEFDYIRVMDPLSINHSDAIVDWDDRVTTANSTYSMGVPWEPLFYIANQNDQDIWINIPHRASDSYVTSLIDLINTTLEAGRHIYVEYSNEIWNSIFDQYKYCRDQGKVSFGAEIAAADAVAWWNARRSAQIWRLFEDNLTGGRTFTRVISGQGVNSYRAQQTLQALADPIKNPTTQRADAIAIAFYFGVSPNAIDYFLTDNGNVPRANVTIADVEDLLNHLDAMLDMGETEIYGVRRTGLIDHVALAKTYGARVIGYEGGQSYYIGTGYDQLVKAATTPVTKALSNHPRMRDLYNNFLTVWFENGGKEFSNFSYINAPQSSGAWGIYDYSGDTEGLYKLLGLRDMMGKIKTCVTEPKNCSTEDDCKTNWPTYKWITGSCKSTFPLSAVKGFKLMP